jgi:hypothetical protein
MLKKRLFRARPLIGMGKEGRVSMKLPQNRLEGVWPRKDGLYVVTLKQLGQKKSVLSDEFIIGGYTQGTGNGQNLRIAASGTYDKKRTGFRRHRHRYDTELLADLKTPGRSAQRQSFSALPLMGKPPGETRLVAEVKFAERIGYLRAPVFLRCAISRSLRSVWKTR